jgi:hypothetical protein
MIPKLSDWHLQWLTVDAFDSEQHCYWQERDSVDQNVGQARFPRISVITRQFLDIPATSATAERVFSFAGLTF